MFKKSCCQEAISRMFNTASRMKLILMQKLRIPKPKSVLSEDLYICYVTAVC